MRIRPPDVLLHRAQVILVLAALIPTILTTPIGIVLLVGSESSVVAIVGGVLVLAFCASSLAGYVLGSIFLRRGASLVRIQNEFLSSVSHELRTPMTSMRMFVEALRNDRLTDAAERERCLAVLHEEMVRLDGLLERLLDLSRIQVHPFRFESVAVASIVDAALTALEAIEFGASSRVEVALDAELSVRGDRASLTQVLVNLLSNAWKFTGEDKRIELAARSAGEREVELYVCDNGPGIPALERKRMFEKFERGTTAIERGIGGSGLGLAIVRAVVEQHNGRIELRSPREGGACFHVFLPRAMEPMAVDNG